METALSTVSPSPVLTATESRDAEKQAEMLLDALKIAVAEPGEHRLFRWGKLDGLFTSRSGPSGHAATFAVKEGLLEQVRSENKGKLVVEWVRATPYAVSYLHEHDSPKAVLRELKEILGETRAGIPLWMQHARDEAAQLAMRFEHQSREMLRRLDALSERVEAALRRVEMQIGQLSEPMARLVPWGNAALDYLDQRRSTTSQPCPLPELFHAMNEAHEGLTLTAFHDGLRRLLDSRQIRLFTAPLDQITEPEYGLLIDGKMQWTASR